MIHYLSDEVANPTIEIGTFISFRYDKDGPWILDKVSWKAEPGEFVAFVGPSGSGKSTMLRLLLGFEKPDVGKIYFGGHDVAAVDITAIRRQMGVVLQGSRVRAGSIKDNILGLTTLGMDDAWRAAEMAGIAEDIRKMPMGMHTIVTEGGSTFSGGQKLQAHDRAVGRPDSARHYPRRGDERSGQSRAQRSSPTASTG